MISKLNCGVCVMSVNRKPTSTKDIGMNSIRLPESSGLKGVIRGMSESPELELIHGDLCEIAEKLEKINKNLEKLNYILDMYLESIQRRLWEASP